MDYLIAWWDLVLITLLFVIPPAMLLAEVIVRRLGDRFRMSLAVLALLSVLFVVGSWSLFDWRTAGAFARQASRSIFFYLPMLAVFLAVPARGDKLGSWSSLSVRCVVTFVAFVFAIIVPYVYTQTRCEILANVVTELLGQSRLVEARQHVQKIVIVNPSEPIGTMAASELNHQLDSTIRGIREVVSRPLSAQAPPPAQFQRARLFGMLGDRDNASQLLTRLQRRLPNDPRPVLLAATLEEHSRNWQASHRLYALAYQNSEDDSTKVFAAQAMRGMAYVDRHSGRIERAREEYQNLIKMAPTAENHYLAAKFYQTYQQPTEARYHAQMARRLSPQKYSDLTEQILNGLKMSQMSCWTFHE